MSCEIFYCKQKIKKCSGITIESVKQRIGNVEVLYEETNMLRTDIIEAHSYLLPIQPLIQIDKLYCVIEWIVPQIVKNFIESITCFIVTCCVC